MERLLLNQSLMLAAIFFGSLILGMAGAAWADHGVEIFRQAIVAGLALCF